MISVMSMKYRIASTRAITSTNPRCDSVRPRLKNLIDGKLAVLVECLDANRIGMSRDREIGDGERRCAVRGPRRRRAGDVGERAARDLALGGEIPHDRFA